MVVRWLSQRGCIYSHAERAAWPSFVNILTTASSAIAWILVEGSEYRDLTCDFTSTSGPELATVSVTFSPPQRCRRISTPF